MTQQRFKTEKHLVSALLKALTHETCPLATRRVVKEYDYESGRTDVLALTGSDQLVAFEAKLQDWRRAIRQAWRNTSYVDLAYVVLPADRASVAIEHIDHFVDYGVGLCFIENGSLRVAIESLRAHPVLGWLSTRAREALNTNGKRSSSRTCKARLQDPVACPGQAV
jgi:hypothetical protein